VSGTKNSIKSFHYNGENINSKSKSTHKAAIMAHFRARKLVETIRKALKPQEPPPPLLKEILYYDRIPVCIL
jgi:hypothetical protein